MPNSSSREEPEPPNELERLIRAAAEDPSLQGKMFRKLWASELHIYVPAHPEWVGEHTRNTNEGLIWCTYGDAKGPFAAVLTSEAAAHDELRNVPEPLPMICSMQADVLFGFLNDKYTTVRIMASGGGVIRMEPEAVAALVEGEFTHNRVEDAGEKEQVMLRPLADEKVPQKLRQAIRVFCAKRRVPIGVYVFQQLDPATGEYPGDDLRVILWLRGVDNDFYNDFCLMAQKLTPPHLHFYCAVITSEDEPSVAFLQGYQPLWPLLQS
jgi:hypothetical protein